MNTPYRKSILTSFFMSFMLMGINFSSAQTDDNQALSRKNADQETPQPPGLEEIFSFLPEVVATYDGKKVTAAEVRDTLPPRLVMMMANGYKPQPEQLKQIAIQTANQIINQQLLLDVAESRGFEPQMTEAQSEVEALRQRVGPEKFKAGLQHQGVDREELTERLARQMAVNTWIEEEIIPAIEIDDATLRELYQERKDQLRVPEKVKASHILVKVEEDASEETRAKARREIASLARKIKEGADFAALAKEHSDCPSANNGGDLGEITRTATVKPFSDAAFALEAGEISDVVETRFGYHIIQTREKTPAQNPSFEDAEDQLKQQVVQQKLNQRLDKIVEEVRANKEIRFMIPDGPSENQ